MRSSPPPVRQAQTLEPVTPDFLEVLFSMELILQEVSTERYIDIPEDVHDRLKRARRNV